MADQDWFDQHAPAATAPSGDWFGQHAQPAAASSEDSSATLRRGLGTAVLTLLGIPSHASPEGTDAVGDAVIGAAKGAGHTAVTLGELLHKIPGVSTAMDAAYGKPGLSRSAFAAANEDLQPTSPSQKLGYGAEQAAEFLAPSAAGEDLAAKTTEYLAPKFANTPRLVRAVVKLAPRVAAQSAAAAGTATAQGTDPETGAIMGATGPILGAAATRATQALSDAAVPLVRAAVKPTVQSMKSIAGKGTAGLDAQANQLVRFLIDNRVTTPSQAVTIVTQADNELQAVLKGRNPPTDAPSRALRYLQALERSASKQALPDADVATIRNAAAQVLNGGMGTDAVQMVPKPHPTLVDGNGQPITVLQPETTRVPRTDVSASEALDRARATSLWDTRKSYGEMQGAQKEASKAVERAQRDAVKAAVPEAAPLLKQQQQGLKAAEVLDRMQLRTGNRDALSLPGAVAAGSEIAAGKAPIFGLAVQWLRNNQMRAGIWADRLAMAIQRQDVQETTAILNRFGVGLATQAGGPSRP